MEPSDARRLRLMSDGIPFAPRRLVEEDPPILPASSGEVRAVHQVEVVAMEGDTEKSSRLGGDALEPEHDSVHVRS